jgi:hypothetical protein
MGFHNNQQNALVLPASYVTSGSRTNFSLNSAYVHRTSGAGFAIRLRVPKTGNLSDWYVLLDLTTGTRANITLRGQTYGITGTTVGTQPGTNTIGSSVTVGLPAADDRWVRFQLPSSIAVTRNDVVWFVIENLASVPATDFPGLVNGHNLQFSSNQQAGPLATVTSANGFSTAGTVGNQRVAGMCVIDGETFGAPFTASTSPYTSNTLRRGARFSNVLKNFQIVGALLSSFPTGSTTLEFCDSTAAPGTTITTRALNNLGATLSNTCWFDPVVLSGNNPFHVVYSGITGAGTLPSVATIEGYSDFPTVFDSLKDELVQTVAIQDNGAGGWNVFPQSQPILQLICESLILPSSSGLLSQGFVF